MLKTLLGCLQTVHIVVNMFRDSILCLLRYVFVFKFYNFITSFDIVLFTRSIAQNAIVFGDMYLQFSDYLRAV